MTKENLICIGAIKGVHGVRGQIRLLSFTEQAEDIFTYAPITDASGTRTFALSFRGMGNDHFIAAIEGVTTREEADKLKGTQLFIARDRLPEEEEGEFYQADLEGLDVRDESGVSLGRVIAMYDYGAGPFLEVQPAKGKSFMVPFKDEFVPTVDVEAGYMIALLPSDWIEEPKAPKEKPSA